MLCGLYSIITYNESVIILRYIKRALGEFSRVKKGVDGLSLVDST